MSLDKVYNKSALQKISPIQLGGDVVAIMLRKKMLLGAMQRATMDKARVRGARTEFTQNPVNIDFISGVPVTTRLQEGYTYAADVTEFPVETGVFYEDHVILRPVRIDLVFEVSNWEKGNPKHALELLEDMYSSRKPVDLLTEHKKISNMILLSLNAETKMPEWGKLVFRASFQKIHLIALQATSIVSKEQVTATDNTQGPVATKSLEPPALAGAQSPKTPTGATKLSVFGTPLTSGGQ